MKAELLDFLYILTFLVWAGDAFLPAPRGCLAGPALWSSVEDADFSKLMGRRSKIKRQHSDETPKEEDNELKDIENESFDLDEMPELNTKRDAPAPKITDGQSDSEVSSEPSYIDYFADYDDENDFHIPNRIGISTSAWGNEKAGFEPSGKLKAQSARQGKFIAADLQAAFHSLIARGVLLFETSPEYGSSNAGKNLTAEDLLSRCIHEGEDGHVSPLLVGTYANSKWQVGSKGASASLSESCERLDVSSLDVYQVKNLGLFPGNLAKGMEEGLLEMGIANYAGMKDLSPTQLQKMTNLFDTHGMQVATNSFDFSLTNRKNEKWIQACKTMGVTPLITDPFNNGLASGKYTASNPTGGSAEAAKFSFSVLEKLQPLHHELESVAERVRRRVIQEVQQLKDKKSKINTDITTSQIALHYVIAKGGVPLVEVNNPKQAEEVIGCLGWKLLDEDVGRLEAAAELCD